MNTLEEIVAHTREELAERKRGQPPEALRAAADAADRKPLGFRRALAEGPAPRIIAEIKRRSPSRGVIREDFDAVAIARAYADAGAAALSVLTDAHYFGGSLAILEAVRREVTLPLLRKDFVVDPFQIDEARVAGADAILLIVAALDDAALAALDARARRLGLDVLVEVHDGPELARAVALGADLIGVNNRDLRSFETDLAATEKLAPDVPEGAILVSESGIFTAAHVERLAGAGARAFLVGESLMREADPGAALRRLRGRT